MKREISQESREIQRVINAYFENTTSTKLERLNEMGTFLIYFIYQS